MIHRALVALLLWSLAGCRIVESEPEVDRAAGPVAAALTSATDCQSAAAAELAAGRACGSPELAAAHYIRSIGLCPTSAALRALADVRRAQGRTRESELCLQAAADFAPIAAEPGLSPER